MGIGNQCSSTNNVASASIKDLNIVAKYIDCQRSAIAPVSTWPMPTRNHISIVLSVKNVRRK
jgi:hypothetical protein